MANEPGNMDTVREQPSASELMKLSKAELAHQLWGEIRTNIELNSQLRAARSSSETGAQSKPVYVLGRTTIERVAEDGQLNTEQVAFVAADELFHKNPYARVKIVSCACGQALLDWWPDCHMCGKKREDRQS